MKNLLLLLVFLAGTQVLFAQTFTELPVALHGAAFGSISFADINGDGDEDVLITGIYSVTGGTSAYLYSNDGSGNYTLMSGTPFDGVPGGGIAFADVEGDGDQDVLITGLNNSGSYIAKLYNNDGNGNYTLVSGTPFDGVRSGSIAFADVDGDGDQDVLITGEDSLLSYTAKLYSNDGSGNYTLVSGTPFDGVINSSIAIADIDGDGDQDVLITGLNNMLAIISKLYSNDGSGNYTLVSGTPFDGVIGSSIAFADADGDGDEDVLITGENNSGSYIAKLYHNDGSGNYTLVSGTPFDGARYGSMAFADIDGDMDQDVLITGENNTGTYVSKLYSNDGSGNYTLVSGTPFNGVQGASIAFADVDGDGDEDVLIIGRDNLGNYISKLYNNDGSGNFTLVNGTPFDGVGSSSIAFSDVDGDGDQDVLITGANISGSYIAELYINDGIGNYALESGTPFDGVIGSIAFADVDGDGDQDVLITGYNNSGGKIAKLYSNGGSGNYTLVSGTPFAGVGNSSIAFADIDGDGDQDVLITGLNNTLGIISKLYSNDGSGNYSLVSGTPFDGVTFSSIGFADVEGDGDKDVLITGQNISGILLAKLYSNDGSGNYTLMSSTPFDGVFNSSIAFADVDVDGDQDVLITGLNVTGAITKLYSNDGNGNYNLVSGTPFDGVFNSSIAFADVDGDMDQDLMITGSNNSGSNIAKLYSNDGSGNYTLVSGTPFHGVFSSSIAFADVDGDGDEDVLITGRDTSNRIAKLYLNDGTVSIGETNMEHGINLVVYPNPTQGTIRFKLEQVQKELLLSVINLQGQEIKNEKFSAVDNFQITLEGSAGMYFVHVTNSEGQSLVIKVIKE
ncbi:MAG: T9SS type A sorting domain-containing protein [Bacteroidia bacterium]|nr:T9SS type A sorting domain-containing protein [Bacteroidia bacterium]